MNGNQAIPDSPQHVVQALLQAASFLTSSRMTSEGEPFTSKNGQPSISSFEALFMLLQKDFPSVSDNEKTSMLLQEIERLYSLELSEPCFRAVYTIRNVLYNVISKQHKSALWTYHPGKVAALTKQLESRDKHKPITITMTTCKRMDLFSRTVNSMIQCITDIGEHVYEWIVIDDNSSQKDREMIKKLYPFIRLIEKTPEEKGHPKSMLILQREVSTPYFFHIEDDWEFFIQRPYCSMLLHVIRQQPDLKQALVNIDYTEDQHTANGIKGSEMITMKEQDRQPFVSRYFVHRYFTGKKLEDENRKLGAPNSMYWPHYSFRVGLTDRSIFDTLGPYSETASHFEMDYSHRYVNAGYKTAFLDGIFCTHIGRRTYERNTEKRNAYDLNQEKQFGEPVKDVKTNSSEPLTHINQKVKNPLDIKPTGNMINIDLDKNRAISLNVINLKRRTDRLVQFFQRNSHAGLPIKVFEGVDGKTLTPTPEIQALFETGDYNYRRGIVGCAMSHIELWKRFMQDPSDNYLVVFEDDVVLAKNFGPKLLDILSKQNNLPVEDTFELCFLHYNPYPQYRFNRLFLQYAPVVLERWPIEKSMRENMGSGAAYILTREGARKLLQFINDKGVFNAIDWVMFKSGVRTFYSSPMLAFAECFQSGAIDTDIQNSYESVRYDNWTKHEVDRWRKSLETNVTCNDKSLLRSFHLPEDILKSSASNKIIIQSSLDEKTLHSVEKVVITTKQHIPMVQSVKGPFVWYTTDLCLFIVPLTFANEDFLKSVPLCNQKLI